jgi:hypothetical protein
MDQRKPSITNLVIASLLELYEYTEHLRRHTIVYVGEPDGAHTNYIIAKNPYDDKFFPISRVGTRFGINVKMKLDVPEYSIFPKFIEEKKSLSIHGGSKERIHQIFLNIDYGNIYMGDLYQRLINKGELVELNALTIKEFIGKIRI